MSVYVLCLPIATVTFVKVEWFWILCNPKVLIKLLIWQLITGRLAFVLEIMNHHALPINCGGRIKFPLVL
jgi:hypothetical protein